MTLLRFLEREETAIIRLERLEAQSKDATAPEQKAAAYKRFIDFHGTRTRAGARAREAGRWCDAYLRTELIRILLGIARCLRMTMAMVAARCRQRLRAHAAAQRRARSVHTLACAWGPPSQPPHHHQHCRQQVQLHSHACHCTLAAAWCRCRRGAAAGALERAGLHRHRQDPQEAPQVSGGGGGRWWGGRQQWRAGAGVGGMRRAGVGGRWGCCHSREHPSRVTERRKKDGQDRDRAGGQGRARTQCVPACLRPPRASCAVGWIGCALPAAPMNVTQRHMRRAAPCLAAPRCSAAGARACWCARRTWATCCRSPSAARR